MTNCHRLTGIFLAITGETEAASISVQIDEGEQEVIAISKTEFRDRSISLNDLPVGRHSTDHSLEWVLFAGLSGSRMIIIELKMR